MSLVQTRQEQLVQQELLQLVEQEQLQLEGLVPFQLEELVRQLALKVHQQQEFRRLHAFRGTLALLRWDAAVTMPRACDPLPAKVPL